METRPLARAAVVLSRNPLGLLAFCLMFVYVVAGTVCGLALHALSELQRSMLVGFIVVFPCAVLAVLYRLVSRYHGNLYAPSDFQNDGTFVRVLRHGPSSAALEPSRAPNPSEADASQGTSCLTPMSPPELIDQVVQGEDFQCVVSPPSANLPRPRPGFYVASGYGYYVTLRHRIFIVRTPGEPLLLWPVKKLPSDAVLMPSEQCSPESRALAGFADCGQNDAMPHSVACHAPGVQANVATG